MTEYNFKFKLNADVPRFDLDFTAGYIGEVKVLGIPVAASPTQDQINIAVAEYIQDHPGAAFGISEEVKQALLQIARKVWYVDDQGQEYYDDLYNALYPPAELVSISAVYTQSGTVKESDSLDSLRDDLVVTALYSDASTQTVSNYTLSGSLVEGTSTITVTYEGMTDTFDVVVSSGMILLYTIPGSDLEAKSLSFSPTKYSSNSSTRISYIKFDLLIEYGKTYKIVTDTDVSTADMSVHVYNTAALQNVANSANISTSYVSYSWKGGVEWEYTAGKIGNYNAACFRLSYRYSTSDPTITTDFIDEVRIYEVNE